MSAAATETLLVAEGLVYSYPKHDRPALDGVDLELVRGQSIGLLGPNGSGKSTLIGLLVGLKRPQHGQVRRIGQPEPVVAWVPQEYSLYPDLSCQENLELFAGMLDLQAAQRRQRVDEAIAAGQLAEFAARPARHCSGGMRRRLNLAIALLARPDVLLLDEPTVGVDPQSRAFLLERVRDLVRQGTAVLYATHYMEEAAALCSHIMLLDRGRVLAAGDLPSLLRGEPGQSQFADLEALFMHHTDRRLRD